MNFYITLPSNASEKDYPNNTKTHFKTKLKNAKYLDGTYEIALVDYHILFLGNTEKTEE